MSALTNEIWRQYYENMAYLVARLYELRGEKENAAARRARSLLAGDLFELTRKRCEEFGPARSAIFLKQFNAAIDGLCKADKSK